MRQGRFLRLALISMLSLSILLVFTWLPLLSGSPVALAHAFVIGSDPVDGSTISTPPAVVRIFFNAPISSASSAHVYFGIDNQVVDAGHSSIARNNPQELDTPLVTPGELPQGSYTVRWTALANDDGHATQGVIGFNVGHSSTGLPGQSILGPSTSNILPQLNTQGVLAIAWDWLVMAALALWIGILVMESLVLAGERTEGAGGESDRAERGRPGASSTPTFIARVRKQALPLQWLCLAALCAGEIINLILRATLFTQASGNSGIDLVTIRQLVIDTNYGHLWLIRIALIGLGLGFLWWTTRTENARSTAGKQIRAQSRRSNGRNKMSTYSRLRQQVAQEAGSSSEEQDGREGASRQNTEKHENGEGTEGAEVSVAESAGTNATPTIFVARANTRSMVGAGLTPALSTPALRTSAWPASPRARSQWHTIAWLILAGVILLTLALSDETPQLAQAHVSAVVFDWLYLAAQCAWFGGAAYLGFILLPLLPTADPDQHARSLATLLRRSTPLMLGAIAVLLASGLFLAETSLSSAQQLISDPFGRALLVKIILIACMLLLSGYALFFLRPELHRQVVLLPVVDAEMPARRTRQSALEQRERKLKRTMNALTWLGAGVLLCAALMSFFAPPVVFPAINYASSASGSGSTSTSSSTQAIQTKQVGNLTVKLQVEPARVDNDNTVIISISDSGGNPVSDAQVQLTTSMEFMDMGTAHATIKGGNPTYIATFGKDEAFSMFGAWDILVRIQRPNQAAVQSTFQVMLAG
jgi:methionine-rich copper-binding protein CopC/putative copper export protein